jgi:hypothetical protein
MAPSESTSLTPITYLFSEESLILLFNIIPFFNGRVLVILELFAAGAKMDLTPLSLYKLIVPLE